MSVCGLKLSEFAVAVYAPLQYPVVSRVKLNWWPMELNLKLGGLTEFPFPGTPTMWNAEAPLGSAIWATEKPVTIWLAALSSMVREAQLPFERVNLKVALDPDFTVFSPLAPFGGSVNGDWKPQKT